MWDGLRLFSPSSFSSLPGWMMPPWNDAERGFPPRRHVVDYLTAYERRYDLHPCARTGRARSPVPMRTRTDACSSAPRTGGLARVVVSATGTWDQPFWPTYPAPGLRWPPADTVGYSTPQEFAGQRVAIVGGGNSAAQILAEVSRSRHALGHPARAEAPARRRRRPRTVRGRNRAGAGAAGGPGASGGRRPRRHRCRAERARGPRPGSPRRPAHVHATHGHRARMGRRHRGAGGHRHLVHRLPSRAKALVPAGHPRSRRAVPTGGTAGTRAVV